MTYHPGDRVEIPSWNDSGRVVRVGELGVLVDIDGSPVLFQPDELELV